MARRSHDRKNVTYEEVIELFDFFRMAFAGAIIPCVENYLQKGDRIITLAKQRFAKKLQELEVTAFEELLFSVDPKNDWLIDAVGKKVIRPILKKVAIVDGRLDTSDELYSQMMDYLKEFNLSIDIPDYCQYKYRFKRALDSGDTMLCVSFQDKDLFLNIYGTKCYTHAKNNYNILFRNGDCVCDIAVFLSWLIVLAVFKKTIIEDKPSYKDYIDENRYTYYRRQSFNNLIPFLSSSVRGSLGISEEDYLTEVEYLLERPWLVPKNMEETFEKVKGIVPDGVRVDHIDEFYETMFDIVEDRVDNREYRTLREIPLLVSDEIVEQLFKYEPIEFMTKIPKTFCYSMLLNTGRRSHSQWAMPSHSNTIGCIVSEAFHRAHKKTHAKITELKELRKETSDYAKSFITKKNINKETLKAMEESPLNNYFGYVEFDNDVDLHKAADLTEEFIAVKETYLCGIDSSDNCIRFRKLGNHKALGLYYPGFKCLCVDISSPSSLLHEYAHLIDYCYGDLSKKSDFSEIRRAYERNLRSLMSEDKAFRELMCKGTKYGLDYYLKPTEVFARSFEIYCARVLELKNSLTPDVSGQVYPTNDTFVEMVKEYFDALLPILNQKEEGK